MEDVCPHYKKTKKFLDKAVDQVYSTEGYRNAAVFGTRVHKELKNQIEAKNDPNWTSEISLEKILRDELHLTKNLRKQDWCSIGDYISERKAAGKDTLVIHHGKPMDPRKVSKETRRYRHMSTACTRISE